MSEHGIVLSVKDIKNGDTLAADASATDTEIVLDDSLMFKERGGRAYLLGENDNKEEFAYTGLDEDTDTLFLSAPLAGNFLTGDEVIMLPETAVRYADIELSGYDDEAPIRARVPFHMLPFIPLGTRDNYTSESESVSVTVKGSEWVVEELIGYIPVKDLLIRTWNEPDVVIAKHYTEAKWIVDDNYRIVGARATVGYHDADDHPDDGAPQGASIQINFKVQSADRTSTGSMFSSDSRLIINAGTHEDEKWIRDNDPDFNIKELVEDEIVTVIIAQVGSTYAGLGLSVQLLVERIEV